MSHEIRTPLNAVISISDLLTKNNEDIEKEYIQSLKFSSKHLMNIINDILDFSKLEAGKISIDSQSVGLKALIRNIKRTYKSIANKKQLDLSIQVDESLHHFHLTNDLRFTQIIGNLINNALKFTHQGSVTIAVKKVLTTKTKGKILFSISDTGIGIPKEQIKTIFSDFSQLSNSITKTYGGTGLSLTIVSELLQLFHSEIHVEPILSK